jgi:hypothetical protein
MRNLGPDGTASSPVEQDRSIVESLEARRPKGEHRNYLPGEWAEMLVILLRLQGQ